MSQLISALPWLLQPPADFSVHCRGLTADTPELGRSIQALANCAMDGNQLQKLANAIGKLQASDASLAPLTPLRLGILGNGTQDFVAAALVASAARHGLALQTVKGEYDQVLQEANEEHSSVNAFQPQAVLIAVDYRALPWQPTPGDAGTALANVEMAMNYLQSVRDAVHRHSGAVCIVQTLAAPPETLFGSYERRVPGTPLWLVDEFNRRLVDSLAKGEDLLLDVAQLAATVGLDAWHSPAEWNMAKLPFASDCLPLYADHLARLLAAWRGRSRRCLILDLDNTVWGGVIGDDGLEGIKVAQGDATGEAHLAVQRMALALRERGIVLAVSSKNTEEIARKPFQEHPEMLLREEHFAAFQANWQDKATNIKAIAESLALGLDAMVFLDDNPVERGLIRQILPQVAVPELEEDPASYARTLAAAGYFEAVLFSEEDRKRAALYQENARRITLQQQAGDVNAYLASLDMEIVFKPFDAMGRARVAQLINKSNQYNLTTRRYTEADVLAAEQEAGTLTLQVRLIDRFGDNGMISVIICRPSAPDTWAIDTWLMSCRVLGRQVEDSVLCEILAQARQRGITRLVGEYIPSERNMMVQKHYQKLGFAQVGEEPNGTTLWELSTDVEKSAPLMRVRHESA